jgi:hypothetical protein
MISYYSMEVYMNLIMLTLGLRWTTIQTEITENL